MPTKITMSYDHKSLLWKATTKVYHYAIVMRVEVGFKNVTVFYNHEWILPVVYNIYHILIYVSSLIFTQHIFD